jgi:sodium transport system permease protein
VKLLSQVTATVFRFEILSLVRDRRTILISVVLPAILVPVMLGAGQWIQGRREAQVLGGTYWCEASGENLEQAESLFIEAMSVPYSGDSLNLLFAGPGLERAGQDPGTIALEVLEPVSSGPLGIRILYRADDEGSGLAASNLAGRFTALRDTIRTRMLADRGCRYGPDEMYVTRVDTSPPWRSAGARIGTFAILFLMVFLLSGGAIAAIDTVAGEREKGTLETLLASSASRAEIIQAKFLAILAVSAVISLTQLLSLAVCAWARFIPSDDLQALRLTPGALAQALLLISGRASSVKEAQLHYFPIFMLGILPGLAPVFPGIESGFPFVLIPVSGVALCMRDVLAGRADLLNVLLSAASTISLAGAALWAASRALAADRMIAGVDASSGRPSPANFPSRVLRIIAVMWAVTTIFSFQAARADIRIQLAFNLLVVLLGGSFFVMRRYRLGWKEHFGLRIPSITAVALAVPGAISGTVAVVGMVRLLDSILPVPPAQMQALSDALLPVTIPRWQLLLFLAVLPGFCEELAFRGMLLGGLSRRMPRGVAVLLSALLFGFYHYSWFRILPTAILGGMLGASVVLSGSVVPAMIWHALNNAVAVLLPAGVDLGNQPTWIYLASAVVCIACLYEMGASARKARSGQP